MTMENTTEMLEAPPHLQQPLRWGSPRQLAEHLNRPYFTVMWWLRTGTLADFGIRSYQDSSKRWWIELPQ
jgi:hypothetical protein